MELLRSNLIDAADFYIRNYNKYCGTSYAICWDETSRTYSVITDFRLGSEPFPYVTHSLRLVFTGSPECLKKLAEARQISLFNTGDANAPA